VNAIRGVLVEASGGVDGGNRFKRESERGGGEEARGEGRGEVEQGTR